MCPSAPSHEKNWNICSGGNQDEVAAANGGPDAGWYILEDLLPQTIGNLLINDCTTGVRVLSSLTVDRAKNMASDGAYNLASQLLAAHLNEDAGAEWCPAAADAVLAGQALLDQVNFNGTGSYLGPKVKGDLLALRNQALALANTLDQYNNGNLCP